MILLILILLFPHITEEKVEAPWGQRNGGSQTTKAIRGVSDFGSQFKWEGLDQMSVLNTVLWT